MQSCNKDNIGIFSRVESFRSGNDLWVLHGNKGYPMIQDHKWNGFMEVILLATIIYAKLNRHYLDITSNQKIGVAINDRKN